MQFFNAPTVFSVTQLSRYLKELLETDDILQNIWVQGEISGCKTYTSGHCYFTLKDTESQLQCVFFKNARLRSSAPDLRDGMGIAAYGRISFYERDGKLQLYVEGVELLGEGALFLRFEQLKARLAAEGLFDENRKRPLPAQPAVIGIVTSPQAAALRDMLRVLRSRYPLAKVILAPTLVQGSEAPASIAAAIELLNEQGEAEVIIVGRGGGSIEELWAFNEEIVARAIARSRIPVISGVGHETDFTIADLVADYRASTPTAAAAAAVPDIADWQIDLQTKQEELNELMVELLSDLGEKLEREQRDLQRANPRSLLDRRRQQLDDTALLLQTRLQHILSLRDERLRGLALRLHALSPLITIARGYAVVRRDSDSAIVTSVQHTHPGDALTIQVTDGSIPVEVRTT
ncbi:MAG: exodeoxyribonuclease VII large subunit [Ktedonobacter sp. 13_1_40CM_4_52_4]|nr:MAG: exodeoxyribonuclease VII large subunit [Ktedonobacter sp. 13_1_40CM_4_52_4]